jgi:peptide/nickel transport system substrate-binding protein
MRSRKYSLGLAMLGVVLVLSMLAGCAPATPQVVTQIQTVVVEKQVPVEKQVVQTVVVEKEKVVEVTVAPGTEKPKSGGILKFGQAQSSQSANPWGGGLLAATDWNIAHQVYESLVNWDPQHNVIPQLAESWESPSATEFTFHLRKGVKFHNGTEMTAKDVVYSFQKTMDAKISAYAAQWTMVDKVEAVDDYTVKFTLKEAFSPFLDTLAMPNMFVTPEGTIEKTPFEFIGTGPFMLKQYVPGQTAELVKNPDYWEKGIPYLDGISMSFLTDDAARVANLQSGAVDFIMMVPGASWATLAADKNYRLYTGDTGIFFMFTFNIGREPFNDPNVLKALQWIPDKAVMCQVYTAGRCNRWFKGDPQAPNSPLYTGIEDYTGQDLNKAKDFLSKSKYPNGFTAELDFYGAASDEGQVAEILQINAAKIGINFKVTALDHAVWIDKIYKGNFDAALQGLYGRTADEIFYAIPNPKGASHGFMPNYDNADYNKLVEKAREITDVKERQSLYAQALKLGYDTGWPVVYLFTYDDRMGMKADVMGYQMDGTGTARFLKYVWLNR